VFSDEETGPLVVLRAHGYFQVVGSGPSPASGGSVTISLTCGIDSGTATFKFLPSITLTPSIGNKTNSFLTHSSITVVGTGFASNAATCSISGTPVNASSVHCGPIIAGSFTGSFEVPYSPAPADGNYTVTVVPDWGPSATAVFRSTAPRAVALTLSSSRQLPANYNAVPQITVPLGYGSVFVTGAGFPSNHGCTLASSPGLVFSATSCFINGAGAVTASFTVDPTTTPASYSITVTDSVAGVSASTGSFLVVASAPAISLSSANGAAGKSINITGTAAFSALDGGPCSISSNPSQLIGLDSSPFCLIYPNNGTLLGYLSEGVGTRFVVSSSAPGQAYTVNVVGSHGDTSGNQPFSVTAAVTATPPQGRPPLGSLPGDTITVSGTGYSPTDTGTPACTISGSGGGVLTVSSTMCSVDPSTGILTATFVVGVNSVFLSGGYTLTVMGSGGDSAMVPVKFFVQPRLSLAPAFGPATTTVAVSGTGFANGGGAACFESTDNVGGTLVGGTPPKAFTCMDSTNGGVSGFFTVSGSVPDATYMITVQGVSASDFASASFRKGVTTSTTTATHPTITLNPISGARGTIVQVTGSGFNSGDVCPGTISSSPPGLIGGFTCSSMSNGQLAGSFTAQNVAPGTYFVTYTGSASDSATASFTVTSPTIVETLTPNSGPVATPVAVTGSGFASTDTCGTVMVSSSPPGLISSFACSSFSGGSLTASFTVAAGSLPGVYIVTVNGGDGLGDIAQAIFTVTTSTPTITLSSSAAPSATIVTIAGSGFNPSDTCSGASITGSIGGLVTAASCSMSNGHIVAASFTVGGVAKASYTIAVTGSMGDFAQAPFTVTTTGSAFISILPPSGRSGASISVSGQIANASGTTCSISGTPVGQASCITTGSTMYTGHTTLSFTGTFAVATSSPGPYLVTVTGGNSSVSGIFTVIGATISLTPPSGAIGITVSISGSGFSSTDTSCTVTSSSLVTNGVCTINSSTGTATGSFLVNVANVAPGPYLVTVTGSPASDVAQATFSVLSGPKITLSPASGTPGTSVTVTGTGFLPADASCSISGTGVQTPACSIVPGSGTPVGSFLISAVAPGSYTITLSGGGGDSAQAIFTVTTSIPTLTFTASGDGYPGQTIPFLATGLIGTDTGCSVTGTNSPDGSTVVGAATCSISTGTAKGTFTVDSLATDEGPAAYTVTVTGTPGGDTVSALFTVIPNITLTPANGVSGTPVAMSGSGFGSKTFSCSPPGLLTSAPGGLFAASPAPTCQYLLNILPSNGQVAGTFTVKSGAPAGTYVVTATDSFGDAASATFTVGTPVAQVTISPNAILPPTSGSVTVGITGSGFNGGDGGVGGCTVTVAAPLTGTCTISGGTAGGYVTVPANPPTGFYLVTITGNLGDFASNYLFVGGVTTISASTTYTTSTSTTGTSTTTTTFTTMTSTSLTTTTYSTTGLSTQSFFQTTVTTVSGLTTTTISALTTTFQTSTATRTVTTTITTSGPILAMQQHMQVASPPAVPDSLGLLALLIIVVPMLFRRLFA
jgi:hypothetical protein